MLEACGSESVLRRVHTFWRTPGGSEGLEERRALLVVEQELISRQVSEREEEVKSSKNME